MARPNSWMYSYTADGRPGPGHMLHNNMFQEPCPEIKEVAMGYKKGSTKMEGVTETMRHKILGACMDLNVATWIIRHTIQTIPTSTYLTIHPTQIQFDKIQYGDKCIVDGGC